MIDYIAQMPSNKMLIGASDPQNKKGREFSILWSMEQAHSTIKTYGKACSITEGHIQHLWPSGWSLTTRYEPRCKFKPKCPKV